MTEDELWFIERALRWHFDSVGEGFVTPEDDYWEWSKRTDDEDWEGLPDRIMVVLRNA